MKFKDYLKSLIGEKEHNPAHVVTVASCENAKDYADIEVLINPSDEDLMNKGYFFSCSSEYLRKSVAELTPELIDSEWNRICLMLNLI